MSVPNENFRLEVAFYMTFWQGKGGLDTWQELRGRSFAQEEASKLRKKCNYAGKPFGREGFLAGMEERFHRRWRRSKMAGAACLVKLV